MINLVDFILRTNESDDFVKSLIIVVYKGKNAQEGRECLCAPLHINQRWASVAIVTLYVCDPNNRRFQDEARKSLPTCGTSKEWATHGQCQPDDLLCQYILALCSSHDKPATIWSGNKNAYMTDNVPRAERGILRGRRAPHSQWASDEMARITAFAVFTDSTLPGILGWFFKHSYVVEKPEILLMHRACDDVRDPRWARNQVRVSLSTWLSQVGKEAERRRELMYRWPAKSARERLVEEPLARARSSFRTSTVPVFPPPPQPTSQYRLVLPRKFSAPPIPRDRKEAGFGGGGEELSTASSATRSGRHSSAASLSEMSSPRSMDTTPIRGEDEFERAR